MENVKVKSWITAPRFAGFPIFLRKLAYTHNLDLKLEVEKGFFNETLFYEVLGSRENVMKFVDDFNLAVSDYQK